MYEMEEMGEPLLSSIHESYPNTNPKSENDEPYLTANTKKNGMVIFVIVLIIFIQL